MIDLRHLLAVFSSRMPWQELEARVARWSDAPRWQFFSGQSFYEDRLPCDAATLVKFRELLGEEGVEELLAG